MELDLFELLKEITKGKSINAEVFIPYIKADMYLLYRDENGGKVESLRVQESGEQYPTRSYETYFQDEVSNLIRLDREFWLDESHDLSNIKYLNKANSKLSLINTHIDLLTKARKDYSADLKRLHIIDYLIDSLRVLAQFYRLVIKKIKAQTIPIKQEKIRLNLSARDLVFLLRILRDQDVVVIGNQELKKTFRVITNSFITKGKSEDNTVDGLSTRWDEHNIIDNIDTSAYKNINKILDKIQKKLKKIEEANASLKDI
jgi:hypothetical protein